MKIVWTSQVDNNLDSFELDVFASKEYLSLKSSRAGWIVSNDFVVPFFLAKKAKVFTTLTFTSTPIGTIDWNELIGFIKESLPEVDLITQPQANVVFSEAPQNAKSIPFGSYVVDLSKSEDDLFAGIHSKHRNVIKKSQKSGVTVRSGHELLEQVYTNIKETMERQKRGYPSLQYLKKLAENLKENISFYICEKEGEIHGSAVLVHNSVSAFYLYGGSIARPFTGALNLLHWEAMLELKGKGVKHYDFMGARIDVDKGSKLDGIQRFKARFGGELKQGQFWKLDLHPLKGKLYSLALKLNSLIKEGKFIGDAIDQEYKKWR